MVCGGYLSGSDCFYVRSFGETYRSLFFKFRANCYYWTLFQMPKSFSAAFTSIFRSNGFVQVWFCVGHLHSFRRSAKTLEGR